MSVPQKVENRLSVSANSEKESAESSDFVGRLRQIVNEAGKPAAFARQAKLSDSVLRKYLDGQSDPSRKRLIQMAASAGVTVEWLATGTGPKKRQEKQQTTPQENVPLNYLDPEIVLQEAEFVIDFYRQVQDVLRPEQAARALVERVREKMENRATSEAYNVDIAKNLIA